MELRHKVTMISPDIKLAKDEGTQKVLTQLVKQLNDMYKNVYDDLSRILPETVSSLPSAGSEYLNRFMTVTQGSASDKLYICIYNTSTSSYEWKEISYV